jgi:hypothetical protein
VIEVNSHEYLKVELFLKMQSVSKLLKRLWMISNSLFYSILACGESIYLCIFDFCDHLNSEIEGQKSRLDQVAFKVMRANLMRG